MRCLSHQCVLLINGLLPSRHRSLVRTRSWPRQVHAPARDSPHLFRVVAPSLAERTRAARRFRSRSEFPLATFHRVRAEEHPPSVPSSVRVIALFGASRTSAANTAFRSHPLPRTASIGSVESAVRRQGHKRGHIGLLQGFPSALFVPLRYPVFL